MLGVLKKFLCSALVCMLVAANFPVQVHAAGPGGNGKISAMQHGRIVQHDGCSTDTSQLGQTFYNADLSNPQRILFSEGGYEVAPGPVQWSQDGKQYTFGAPRQFEFGLVNADGTPMHGPGWSRMAGVYAPGEYVYPNHIAWAPDGITLALGSSSSLYTMWLDDFSVHFLSWGAFENLSWSPLGEYIAFTRPFSTAFPNYGDGVDVRNQIGVIRNDGTGLYLYPKASPTSFDTEPDWSPDGTKLVFASNRAQEGTSQWNEPTQLFTMNIDGSGVQQLTNNYAYAYEHPVWSPDGTMILATKTKLNSTDPVRLVQINAQTGAQMREYTPACNVGISDIDWQPLADPLLYRMANWKTHERLFTTNKAEVYFAQKGDSGWVYENVAMRVYESPGAGRTTVYRMANWKTKERLFTTDYNEVQHALQHYEGWVFEGTAFYASTDPANTPVYRMANWITHERLFTTDRNERDTIRDKNGWVYEGVAYYAAP